MKARNSFALKTGAFVLAVAAFAATAMLGYYQWLNFNVIWENRSPADGYTIRYLQERDSQELSYLLDLRQWEQQWGSLNSHDQQAKAELEQKFSRENTNLRWQVLEPEGNVLYGNWQEDRPMQPEGLYWTEYLVSNTEVNVRNDVDVVWADAVKSVRNQPRSDRVVQSSQWETLLTQAVENYWESGGGSIDRYAVYLAEDGTGDLLRVITNFGVFLYAPTVENVVNTNVFGYRYNMEERMWTQDVGNGWDGGSIPMDLVLWLETPLMTSGDDYARIYHNLASVQENKVALFVGTVACGMAGLALLVWLCMAAGHRAGTEHIYRNWFHRIPGELVALGEIAAILACIRWGSGGLWWWIPDQMLPIQWRVATIGAGVTLVAVLLITLLVTLCVRVKSKTLVQNTLVWRLCIWGRRVLGTVCQVIPLIWRVVLGSVGYVLVSVWLVAMGFVPVWCVLTVAITVYLCIWAVSWRKIRRFTGELLEGGLDAQLACEKMPKDLRAHAQQLNNLGQSISQAVADRMQSEHFKAELITNVSHDLKTPLTSIINYVDLMKKEPIPNERIAEYLNVLERKSDRLKKLTEDLIEASKASTGVLSVELGRLDLAEIADQALGEYEERLHEAGLAVVRTLPDHPVWVRADGRRLWRVLDNLLSNCAKYALGGSRVYLEIRFDDKRATLEMKNISREELNVPVERLMERFVRGDISRSTEGSGLGLSIAQSMTELQKGVFEVEIDGDLFKAMVTLPLDGEE